MGGTMVYDSGRRPDSLRSPVREQYGAMEITPTGGALGAYVSDIDLSAPLDVEVQQQLRASWLEHLVLVFRDQPISEAAFLTFAQGFGTPGRYPFVTGLPDYPDIIEVKKLEHERNNFGGIWHSDTAYLLDPPMASMLVARRVPAGKGDTEFANMYTAWEQLPEDVRNTVRPLRPARRRSHDRTGFVQGGTPRGPHPSRDRSHLALRQRCTYQRVRGPKPRREPATLAAAVRSSDPPRVHLAAAVGTRHDRTVGQPLHTA